MKAFSIAIHGGAGTLVKGIMTPELEKQYKSALKEALNSGYKILEEGELKQIEKEFDKEFIKKEIIFPSLDIFEDYYNKKFYSEKKAEEQKKSAKNTELESIKNLLHNRF